MPPWRQVQCFGLMGLPEIPIFGLCPTLLSKHHYLWIFQPATFPVDLGMDPICSFYLYKGKTVGGDGQHAHRSTLLVVSGAWLALEPPPGTVCPCCFAPLSNGFPLSLVTLNYTFLERRNVPGVGFVMPVRWQWGHKKQSHIKIIK